LKGHCHEPRTTPRKRIQNSAAPYQPDYSAQFRVLQMCRPYDPEDVQSEIVETRTAYERLRTGHGTERDFDLVSMMLNAILIRAEQIDPLLVETVSRGQMAMVRMQDRYKRGLALGVDGQGVSEIPDALDVYEAVTLASSPAQMVFAIKEAYRRVSNGDVLGVMQ